MRSPRSNHHLTAYLSPAPAFFVCDGGYRQWR
jgi:hypothetical protein